MKVHIELLALTRVCWGCVVEVPDGTDEMDLDTLVDQVRAEVGADQYELDPEYWEGENGYWSRVRPDEPVGREIRVIDAGDHWVIEGL